MAAPTQTSSRSLGDRLQAGFRRFLTAEVLYPTVAVAALLTIWHLTVVLLDLRTTLLPSPAMAFSKVFRSFDTFLTHAPVTIFEIVGGYTLSIVLGVATAFVMVWSRVMEKIVSADPGLPSDDSVHIGGAAPDHLVRLPTSRPRSWSAFS